MYCQFKMKTLCLTVISRRKKVSRAAIRKLILFNVIIFAVNIVVFSNAFLKVRLFADSALETIVGMAVIIGSVLFFIVINYRLISPKAKALDPEATVDKITDLESCAQTIARLDYAGTFSEKLSDVSAQIKKAQKKGDLINDILLQKFSATELSYGKFTGVVQGAEKILVANIKSMLNKICAFDDEEYNEILRGKSSLSPSIAKQKMDIYKEYIDYVDQAVYGNEEILLRLDKLLLEISKFNSLSMDELESMPALGELDTLIRDSKWYK